MNRKTANKDRSQPATKDDVQDAVDEFALIVKTGFDASDKRLDQRMDKLEEKMDRLPDEILRKLDEKLETYVENRKTDLLGVTTDENNMLQHKVIDHEEHISTLETK